MPPLPQNRSKNRPQLPQDELPERHEEQDEESDFEDDQLPRGETMREAFVHVVLPLNLPFGRIKSMMNTSRFTVNAKIFRRVSTYRLLPASRKVFTGRDSLCVHLNRS